MHQIDKKQIPYLREPINPNLYAQAIQQPSKLTILYYSHRHKIAFILSSLLTPLFFFLAL